VPLTPLEPAPLRAALAALPDWRLQVHSLGTAYVAATAAEALALVAAIGAAAEDADHHPDVDWRYRHVFVRTTTHAAGDRVTARDTELAERISALAARAGARAEPALARTVEVGVDTADPEALAPVWAAALGYRPGPHGDVVDPHRRGPAVWFQRTATPAASRLHLDVHVADEVQGGVVEAVTGSGGRVDDAAQAPSFVVVADRDGNRLCVCTAADATAAPAPGP
jgi:4a-hydroxytetrahydrobiopterin dehydratase